MKMKLALVLAGCVLAAVIYFFARRKADWPVGKPCSVCGAVSGYWYDQHAEDLENIKPMCLKCLVAQIEKEYSTFAGHAVVIQPAQGPPSYVFQPIKEWRASIKDTQIADDAASLLAKMEQKCHDCGQDARFLWVESSGLNGDNFGDTLDRGISATLLKSNPKPISLCAKCCVGHIAKDLKEKEITFGEVCSPKGTADGFVVPMGY